MPPHPPPPPPPPPPGRPNPLPSLRSGLGTATVPGRGMPLRGSPPKGLCPRGDLVVRFSVAPHRPKPGKRRVVVGPLGVIQPPVVLLTSAAVKERIDGGVNEGTEGGVKGVNGGSSSTPASPLLALHPLTVRVLVEQTALPAVLAHRARAAAAAAHALRARALRRGEYREGADAAPADQADWLRAGAPLRYYPAPLIGVYLVVGGAPILRPHGPLHYMRGPAQRAMRDVERV
jgi:hypothetical protein